MSVAMTGSPAGHGLDNEEGQGLVLGGVDIQIRSLIEVLDVLAEADKLHAVLQPQLLYLGFCRLQQGAVPGQHQG